MYINPSASQRRMANTQALIDDFKGVLQQYSSSPEKKELEKILANVERITKESPKVYDTSSIQKYLDARSQALNKLLEDYIVTAVSEEYPLLSPELFALKRHVVISKNDGAYTVVRDEIKEPKESEKDQKLISIPLFAYVPVVGNHTVTLGKYTKTTRNQYGGQRKTTVSVTAKLPCGLGPQLQTICREAYAQYFKVLSSTYAQPALGEILLNEKSLKNPELGVIWIPTIDSFSFKVTEKLIPPKRKIVDPAIVLSARGNTYLVQTWNIHEEEPFEHYLREYTTGPLKNKL